MKKCDRLIWVSNGNSTSSRSGFQPRSVSDEVAKSLVAAGSRSYVAPSIARVAGSQSALKGVSGTKVIAD